MLQCLAIHGSCQRIMISLARFNIAPTRLISRIFCIVPRLALTTPFRKHISSSQRNINCKIIRARQLYISQTIFNRKSILVQIIALHSIINTFLFLISAINHKCIIVSKRGRPGPFSARIRKTFAFRCRQRHTC